MTEFRRTAAAAIALLAALFMSLGQALAVDLNGAWATNADECGKVFRKGNANEITFAPDSEINGGGFIVERDQLRGRSAKCTIKARKNSPSSLPICHACFSSEVTMWKNRSSANSSRCWKKCHIVLPMPVIHAKIRTMNLRRYVSTWTITQMNTEWV